MANVLHRLTALRTKMKEAGLDCLLLSHEANVTYLSGFTNRESYLLLMAEELGGKNLFITDSRYFEQAETECGTLFEIHDHKGKLFPYIASLAQQYGAKCIGFEADHLSYSQYQKLHDAVCSAAALMATSGIAERLRETKDDTERVFMQQACAATDRVFHALCPMIKAGIRERELEWQLLSLIRNEGCESSFAPIVVSGARGSLPHGVASDKVIETGDFVTLDFGCAYHGYCADMTRTVHVGPAEPFEQELYQIVLTAHLRAAASLRPGLSCREADNIARSYIAAQGYGDYFGHGLGHGVGLEIHEEPYLNTRNDGILQEGNFVTVEPGIYLPGKLGIRIEDTVEITSDDARSMFTTSKELLCL